ncbi:MAG: hypothetical protein AAGI36_02235 [Pseudomonadota bacterium]
MLRFLLTAALAVFATPGVAQSEKEVSCGYQAEVARAIQQARLDRVRERKVEEKILAGTPTWPDNYNRAIPLMVPWVYELPMKQVRDHDLGDAWNELCLKQ